MKERGREVGGSNENCSTKQREGVNGGHRVMRGLNATNAMSQGLIKTSSALLPRSGHAPHAPVQLEVVVLWVGD